MVHPDERPLPPPDDPTPRFHSVELDLPGGVVVPARDDSYSDRIRCDHPPPCDPTALAARLVATARDRGRGRVVLLASATLRDGLQAPGWALEATMPGFYGGGDDCDVWRFAITPARAELVEPDAVAQVDRLIAQARPGRERAPVATERASVAHAEAIAALVTATFEHYPTPTGVPAYVAGLIAEGVPFRIVRRGADVVACASADLVRSARTAELTDCATRPDQRGGGLMQCILQDLMGDLRALGYPTAFTLARASVAGVNLAFQRLGFEYRGRMASSCRIGGGIEDMNVWSRPL